MTLKLGMLPVLSRINSSATKQVLGQQPDKPVMYEALGSILPYFEKAYELDQLPNEKGKVKPKFTKDIKGILGANHVYYINGGAYYFDQKDYNKAYDFFEQYLKISDMPMFKGEAVAERDSNFMTVLCRCSSDPTWRFSKSYRSVRAC